jgi:hypothetical protein
LLINYYLLCVNQPFFIRNPSSSNLLSIANGICDEGTDIIPLQNKGEDWQKWWLNHDRTIESVHCPGMVIDLEGSQCGYSVSVVLSPKDSCSNSQAWRIRDDGVIVNSKCDTMAIDIAYGSRIITWSIHGDYNQLWAMEIAAAQPTVAPTNSPITPSPTTLSPLSPSFAPTKLPTASPTTLSPTRGVSFQ